MIRNIQVTGRGFTPKESQIDIIEKKLSKLEKFFNEDIDIYVVLKSKKNLQQMEAMFTLKNGIIIRAEAKNTDMNVCIDEVLDKLTRQLVKHKEKIRNHKHTNKDKMFNDEAFAAELPETEFPEEDFYVPVRTKSFTAEAMDVDDAILQMELLEHDFFVYKDIETGSLAVVYRRQDGHFGKLDPKIS
jgi:putative sigma-54 modulation protein